jgi:D-alanyl-D-alanine carboxypeptidase/D-alanyl-D-alanine-endopeptidase (penicillin-binding protein 4)
MDGVRRTRLAAVAAAALVAAPAAGAASLPVRLGHALRVPHVAQSGAVAVDLLTGRTFFAQGEDMPLAPASNEKLTVTYAALRELGPSYRFRTRVVGVGTLVGATWHGTLVLKGFGDPTLTTLRVQRLVNRLWQRGIRRVDGRVLGDESWFDDLRVAQGWKPSFELQDSLPLSALVVDRDRYDGHVALQPAVAAAGTFRRLLRARGIAVAGPAGVGVADPGDPTLAETLSAPLAEVVRRMDRVSDNFDAEMLLKDLGAELGAGGTTAAGLRIVTAALAGAGVPLAGVRLVDGSGLSLDDRLTARALGALLVAIWHDPALRPVVWSALPVAGESGTLKDRMRRRPARGAVRAKTGTTDQASALSGYAGRRYAFAVLENGRPVSWTWARTAQDRFATLLAASALS